MTYDLAVIGAGPAGLMAAGRAAELGAQVILLEKNQQPGIKLLMTGGGRCNLTNSADNRQFATNFGHSGAWLLSGLSRFGSAATIDFFEQHGVATKVEANGRVFPQSDSAKTVLQALMKYLTSGAVDLCLNTEVKTIVQANRRIESVVLVDGQRIVANKFIICSGGQSYPATGSTGDAYLWLKSLGHQIIDSQPVLAPINLKDHFVPTIEGLSLTDVSLTCYQSGSRVAQVRGPLIFTANSLSGPAALNLSRQLARLNWCDLTLKLDLLPDIDLSSLDKDLQLEASVSHKQLKTIISSLVPPKLVDTLLDLANLEPIRKLNSLTRLERQTIVKLLKDFQLSPSGLAGFDRAMITAGGVDLKEVDQRTMRSKLIDNLYLAGEVLDLDGPTGGYNLQVCWTTGYLAGQSAAMS